MSESIEPGDVPGGAEPAGQRGAGAHVPRHAAPESVDDGRHGMNVRWINLLLVIPLIGTLVPEFYNRSSPGIGGMPFFYWYQLVWIAVSVTLTVIVYRATRGER